MFARRNLAFYLLMKPLSLIAILLSLTACAPQEGRLMWRARDLVLAPSPKIGLQGPDEKLLATVSTRTMRELLLAHFRIARQAGVQAELIIVDGSEPNAFMGLSDARYVLGINTAMLNLIGDDMDEFAALLGHEIAHLARGHVDASRTRRATLIGLGTLMAVGLGAVGVPAGGTIANLSVDIIDASYSRDQEREADAVGMGYAVAAGFNPQGAIRLQEQLLKISGGSLLPFLSSHPSGKERIENLRALIQEQQKGQAKP